MSRRTVAVVGLSAVAVAGSAIAAIAQPAASPSPWVATATRAFPLKAVDLGSAPLGEQLHVSVALNLRNRAAMIKQIEATSTPGGAEQGKSLTAAQARAAYSPTVGQASAVRAYLVHAGFRQVAVTPDRLLVNATGSVAAVDKAFDTHIADLDVAGTKIYANTVGASVPRALSSTVASVLGLSDWQMSLPKLHVTKAATSGKKAKVPAVVGLNPMELAHTYDATKLPKAKKTSDAIIMAGNPAPIIKNLRIAEKAYHQPRAKLKVVYGESRLADTVNNPLTGSEEWDLDTQMSTIVPGKVKRLYMYDESTYADPDVSRAINQFVSQDKARNLSLSLGECDFIAFFDGAMTATDNIIAQGGVQGQSVFASTGDNGGTCPEGASTGLPTGPPGVSWPGDGEFTTGVGGTELKAAANGTEEKEAAWGGGGGGISEFETAAPWTLRANVAGQTWQENNFGGRSIPDVSAVASGTPQVLIYAGGKVPEGVDGTSVSSPLVMSLWTRLNSADHNKLGMASPEFYKLYNKTNPGTYKNVSGIGVYAPAVNPKPVKGFRDIVSGDNFTYPAKAGYDYATGIGAPEAKILAQRLRPHAKKHHPKKRHPKKHLAKKPNQAHHKSAR